MILKSYSFDNFWLLNKLIFSNYSPVQAFMDFRQIWWQQDVLFLCISVECLHHYWMKDWNRRKNFLAKWKMCIEMKKKCKFGGKCNCFSFFHYFIILVIRISMFVEKKQRRRNQHHTETSPSRVTCYWFYSIMGTRSQVFWGTRWRKSPQRV